MQHQDHPALKRLWAAARQWLDDAQVGPEGFLDLLRVASETDLPYEWDRLRKHDPNAELGHLELWLLDQLQSEPEESKHNQLWFRMRTHAWKETVDGGEIVLERLLSDSRELPTSEFSEPLVLGREATTQLGIMGALLHEGGHSGSRRNGRQIEAVLAGPLAVGAVAWSVQTTLERIDSSITLGDQDGREVVVGYDAGPGFLLGRCGHDSWYRDSVISYG
ncbi:MAG: hypothetical protein ACI841_004789 [Planctomycetota bacterium]